LSNNGHFLQDTGKLASTVVNNFSSLLSSPNAVKCPAVSWLRFRKLLNALNKTMKKPMSTTPRDVRKLPARYVEFQKRYPAVFRAYDLLGTATADAGPLDPKTRALVKLGIAIGGQMEGAVHSHTRRALEAGCAPDAIRHSVVLATTTLGFPSMMKCLSWVDDVLKDSA
jgi:alkylhydroperoxidase/carboxymuconolactone decarboxylase family protein YurZ